VGPELKATWKADEGQTAAIKRRGNPSTEGNREWISRLSVNQQNLRGKEQSDERRVKREAMPAKDQNVVEFIAGR